MTPSPHRWLCLVALLCSSCSRKGFVPAPPPPGPSSTLLPSVASVPSNTAAPHVLPPAIAPAPAVSSGEPVVAPSLTREGEPCLPGEAPSCSGTKVLTCPPKAVWTGIDCVGTEERCVRGTCAERVCKPGALLCHEGHVGECNNDGSKILPHLNCDAGTVCQARNGNPPGCDATCSKANVNVVLAQRDCTECDWSRVPFCGREADGNSCAKILCVFGELGSGVGPSGCRRETNGLVVPGSSRLQACRTVPGSTASIRRVTEQVCVSGKPKGRTRTERCGPSGSP